VVVYLLLLVYGIAGPYFRIKHVDCSTNTGIACPDFIIPELKKHENELLYLIVASDIEAKLKKNVPQADRVIINQVWPDLISAAILWQQPIANVSIPASTSALLVGNSGQILSQNVMPDPSLPTIIASSAADLIISDHITESSLVAAFDIIKNFAEVNLKTKRIDVISIQDIQVQILEDKIAIFTSLKSIPIQVRTLQLILSQATINPGLRYIDLRLDRPALKPSL
jgi:hypothetical protein